MEGKKEKSIREWSDNGGKFKTTNAKLKRYFCQIYLKVLICLALEVFRM